MASTQPDAATPAKQDAGDAPVSASEKSKSKSKGKITLKTPKGTTDYGPEEMSIRERCMGIIKDCFRRHGAVTIDTPVFELKETLTNKYGEDSKLIYDLQDQGGEICSLRYDLTVPFARYLAMNRVEQMKRFHIAKVYRRDNPVMTKGRYREFYQCDFDIAGVYDPMLPDAECLAIAVEILGHLNLGQPTVKVNHRKLLDGMFAICGVPEEKFRTICSAVDKLDKLPWEEVEKEMVQVKGLPVEIAKKIQAFVTQSGPAKEMLEKLKTSGACASNQMAMNALHEMELLFQYCEALSIVDKIEFNLSLCRGLDYYTGLVFEVIYHGQEVGSVAGGGRYDELVGMFGPKPIPSVGFSIGLERIFTIAEKQAKKAGLVRPSETEVFIATAAKGGAILERLALCTDLWKAEFLHKTDPKIRAQLSYAEKTGIPFAIILGDAEIQQGIVQLKDMNHKKQVALTRAALIPALKAVLANPEEDISKFAMAAPAAQ